MSKAKSKKSKREYPEFPDLLLCLGWVACNGGRGERDRYSAYLMEESTGKGIHIPYAQAVSMMKTHPLRFIRRISVATVQQWVYRMVNPTNESAFREMMTMMRFP